MDVLLYMIRMAHLDEKYCLEEFLDLHLYERNYDPWFVEKIWLNRLQLAHHLIRMGEDDLART